MFSVRGLAVAAGAVVAAGVLATGHAMAAPTVFGPSDYQCFDAGASGGTNNLGSAADGSIGQAQFQLGGFTGTCTNQSPFVGVAHDPARTWFFVESFESVPLGTLANGSTLSVPGVTVSGSQPLQVRTGGNVTDSVDADDGSIDGNGLDGRALKGQVAGVGVTFTFDPSAGIDPTGALNGLFPTTVGIVMTDTIGDFIVDFFDPTGALIASVDSGDFGITAVDDGFNGDIFPDDYFVGIFDAGGIGSLRVYNDGTPGGIEVDHLQFGRVSEVPEPLSLGLLGAALAGLGIVGRRRRWAAC